MASEPTSALPVAEARERVVTRGAVQAADQAVAQLNATVLAAEGPDPQEGAELFMRMVDRDPALMRALALHYAGNVLRQLKQRAAHQPKRFRR
jgi:hypothetical protein